MRQRPIRSQRTCRVHERYEAGGLCFRQRQSWAICTAGQCEKDITIRGGQFCSVSEMNMQFYKVYFTDIVIRHRSPQWTVHVSATIRKAPVRRQVLPRSEWLNIFYRRQTNKETDEHTNRDRRTSPSRKGPTFASGAIVKKLNVVHSSTF